MSGNYEVVIGLEVHAELNTNTKIFCGCKNEFGAPANTLCCPICLSMPGTLPRLNEKVVDYAVMMGHALGCKINQVTKMDRKNYYYPDLTKAYQISQFDIPICQDGSLKITADGQERVVRVLRIHMEEDAGKLIHDADVDGTLADYNRGGVPLIEIVSEPDLRSAEEAKVYMESIAAILLYLGISNVKMQEGNLRADVNVSVRPKGQKEYGTRVEMKNVNSFSAVYRAVEYESARQINLLQSGGMVEQETRRWDDVKNKNSVLRTKEDAQDYRYFPDPDQLTFLVSDEKVAQLKASLPELPIAKALRYQREFALTEYDANLITANKQRADFFETAADLGMCEAKAIANWLLGDILKILNDNQQELSDTQLSTKNLAEMIALIEKGTISNTAGKTVLNVIIAEDLPAQKVVEQKGLAQISDTSALEAIVGKVLPANPVAIQDYKAGKTNIIGFLVGQCMKESRGQGNPAALKELVEKAIEKL